MKNWSFPKFNEASLEAHRITSLLLFGDVAFAVVPLLTLAVINVLLGDNFSNFILIKEWSFATIVFFGVAIRKLIRIKTQVQQTPTSYKLDNGVQFYVLLLIASVLVLSFVILGEKGVLARQAKLPLAVSQLVLFFFGVFSILISIIVESSFNKAVATLPDGISKDWLLRRVIGKLENAGASMDYVVYAIKRASSVKFGATEDRTNWRQRHEHRQVELEAAIEHLVRRVSEAKLQLESLRSLNDAPRPETR
jgi:hypothetical protein